MRSRDRPLDSPRKEGTPTMATSLPPHPTIPRGTTLFSSSSFTRRASCLHTPQVCSTSTTLPCTRCRRRSISQTRQHLEAATTTLPTSLPVMSMASMKQRRRSVPPGTSPSSGQKGTLSDAVIVSPSSSSPSVQPANSKQPSANNRLLAQADALAKMTFELNLRAVSAQAERLEQEIGALVARTSQDKEFRQEHEQRIMDVWREILSVKARMDGVNDTQEDIKVGFDRCQREAAEFKQQLRQEMSDLKGLVDGVASQLDSLPTSAEVEEQLMGGAAQTQQIETRATTRARAQAQTSVQRRSECSKQPPKRRIQEAIKSTRRWHCDHKTTSLTDAKFTANYLKQQSKRDPAMAVLIQRAIQQRIQRRHRLGASLRPRSLEEFCQDVAWADVIETVEEVLLKDEEATAKALR
ncbi:Uncharacterized protein TPAR_03376 [Tolypocladium paradoxum]|uniref:Uncharacterized protein n=1 Tax=Tolypocladium paradoxum TaxID=94208 RepID=A0A2S4L1W8_9HYPO|nr:Uncharacterized protein TPAR_03376 [Tolypocladium paradoxum]